MNAQEKENLSRIKKKYARKKNGMIIPLILVFIFIAVVAIYNSLLMKNAAVSNSTAVIEDRILNVSSMIDNHLNTAQTVLHVTADGVYHMLVSGTTSARIHEFLVEETNNVEEQFNENFTGIYGYIMSQYMDGLNWEPPEGYDPASRDWYIRAREADGDVAFVPPYVDAQTGNMIISVSRMLPDRQNIISLDVQLKGIQAAVGELLHGLPATDGTHLQVVLLHPALHILQLVKELRAVVSAVDGELHKIQAVIPGLAEGFLADIGGDDTEFHTFYLLLH